MPKEEQVTQAFNIPTTVFSLQASYGEKACVISTAVSVSVLVLFVHLQLD